MKPLASERQSTLSDLVNRRHQLIEMLNSERHRSHSVRNNAARSDIEVHIDLKGRVANLDQDIDQLRNESLEWQQQYRWLTNVPGVGRVVATIFSRPCQS